jgi:hypothetical protein
VLIGYFGKEDADFKFYEQFATIADQYDFFHTFSADIKKAHSIDDLSSIVLFTKFDEKKHIYTGEMNNEKFLEFL